MSVFRENQHRAKDTNLYSHSAFMDMCYQVLLVNYLEPTFLGFLIRA